MRSQRGAGSPVPSSLGEAKAICTEPGTPRILQVPFYPDSPTSKERSNFFSRNFNPGSASNSCCFSGRGLTSCNLDFRLWTTPRIRDRKLQGSLRKRYYFKIPSDFRNFSHFCKRISERGNFQDSF